MKILHIGISSLVLVSLAGCSSVGLSSKRVDYRSAAVQMPSLEVPPDLTTPSGDDRYKVPQGDGETVTTYSDYSKGGAAATQGRSVSAVLTQVKGVRLERDGAQRWLVVGDKPENVWPVVKAFWQENGLAIKSEDQASGVMETEWAENRAKIPQGGLRSLIGKVFDNLYSSGERDQYRVRLERSKDGVSTEIYITHRGMQEIVDENKNISKWQARPNDPEMEAIMLQRLMARFGGAQAQSTGAELTKEGLAAVNASGPAGAASIHEISDGSRIIVVNDPFDKSWRRLGLGIEQAGLTVEDKDRAKGIYFLRPVKVESGLMDKLQFWKDNKDTKKRYRVIVKDSGTACEVSVTDQDGAKDDASYKMLEAIHKHINQ